MIKRGTLGSDFLRGSSSNETIHGGRGDDQIFGGGGQDKLHGGPGNDTIIATHAANKGKIGLYGGNGDDDIAGSIQGRGQIHVWGGDGDDQITLDLTKSANGGNNFQGHHAYGGDGADIFNFTNVHLAARTVTGRIDDFNYAQDRIQIEGQTIDLKDLPASVVLTNGSSVHVRIVERAGEFNGSDIGPQQFLAIGDKALYAIEGARFMGTGTAQERHFLPPPQDIGSLKTTAFVDQLNEVPAYLYQGMAFDTRQSPDGSASFSGTPGNDYVYFGKNKYGKNTADGGAGHDVINGGQGEDSLSGGDGNDLLAGGLDADVLYGGNGQDILFGGSEDDKLFGGHGNDSLNGGTGADHLYGGDGDDLLIGGLGADKLFGGSGRDTAVYDGTSTEYAVSDLGNGQTSVKRIAGDRAEADALSDIETIRFKDKTVQLDDGTSTPEPPPSTTPVPDISAPPRPEPTGEPPVTGPTKPEPDTTPVDPVPPTIPGDQDGPPEVNLEDDFLVWENDPWASFETEWMDQAIPDDDTTWKQDEYQYAGDTLCFATDRWPSDDPVEFSWGYGMDDQADQNCWSDNWEADCDFTDAPAHFMADPTEFQYDSDYV